MYFRALLVLCVVLNEIESSPERRSTGSLHDLEQYKRAAVLAKLINLVSKLKVSKENEAEMRNDNQDIAHEYQPHEDSISHENNEKLLDYIVELLIPKESTARLHLIKNPNVLEEYKMKVREKMNNPNNLRMPSTQRRSAVFRLETSSKEVKFSNNLPDSIEKDPVPSKYFELDDGTEHNAIDDKFNDNPRKYEDDYDKRKNKHDQKLNWNIADNRYYRNEKPKRMKIVNNNKREIARNKPKQSNIGDWNRPTTEDWNKLTQTEASWNKDTERYKPDRIRSVEEKHIRSAKTSGSINKNRPRNVSKKVVETTFMPVRTTRRQPERQPYAPRISYEGLKPKKQLREGGGFFGRTPIPYVGKRGVYADK